MEFFLSNTAHYVIPPILKTLFITQFEIPRTQSSLVAFNTATLWTGSGCPESGRYVIYLHQPYLPNALNMGGRKIGQTEYVKLTLRFSKQVDAFAYRDLRTSPRAIRLVR